MGLEIYGNISDARRVAQYDSMNTQLNTTSVFIGKPLRALIIARRTQETRNLHRGRFIGRKLPFESTDRGLGSRA